jgi:hypothetical protein
MLAPPLSSTGSEPTLCPNGPVMYHQPLHWKVSGIAGRQTSSDTQSGSCNETVGLAEGHAATGKLAPPPPGLLPLDPSQRCNPKAVKKASDARLLAWLYSSKEFLDVDGACVGPVAGSAQLTDTGGGETSA